MDQCLSSLNFELPYDDDPAMRTCVLIDVSSLRAQASRALNLNRGFTIDYKKMLRAIATRLGPIIRTEFFLSTSDVSYIPIIRKFAHYAAAMGTNPRICVTFKNERIYKNDPDAATKLQHAKEYELQIIEEEGGWTIINGGKAKNSSKPELAATIAEVSISNKYDCIVLATNDSLFIPIIKRYILGRGLNCGLIYIQDDEHPSHDRWTISSEMLNLFNYRLRFDRSILTIRNDT